MSNNSNEKYSGNIVPPANNQVSEKKKKKIPVKSRLNRKYDLHIGREMITFKSLEQKDIPYEWLKHPDWMREQNNFIIVGVKNAGK